MEKTIILWVSLAIMDVGVLALLRIGFGQIDLRNALREKAPDAQPQQQPGPNVPVADADNTSYSRVAGFIGAMVLACFLWATGNFVVYYAFQDPTQIAPLLGSIGSYFLAGASLFAPYAVNKLSGIGK